MSSTDTGAGGASRVVPVTKRGTWDAIVQEVVYPHPVERVWQALTDSTLLASWLMPNDFEPRVGHRFTFRTRPQWGWKGVVECEVTELDPPRRLAYTWWGGQGTPHTVVTFLLEPSDGGTRLRLEHAGFGSGGLRGQGLRLMLGRGWGSSILHRALPATLDRLASAEAETARGRPR